MAVTIRQLLHETVARFHQAHIDSPATTARVLLAQALGRPREWLVAHDDLTPDAAGAAQLEQLIARVIAREPLAYVLGHREFYGIDLRVDPRVLIPRPETEMLVELALDHLKREADPGAGPARSPAAGEGMVEVIDVGTGSGAAAIAIAVRAPAVRIIATDISADALDVARENAQRCGVADRIEYVEADLLAGVGARARVVVANLPYVTVEEIEALPPEIQSHEPRVALDGGADGLDLVRRLLGQLGDHLLPGGMAVFEIGASQGAAALLAAQSLLPGWRVELKKDLARLDRVLQVSRAAP